MASSFSPYLISYFSIVSQRLTGIFFQEGSFTTGNDVMVGLENWGNGGMECWGVVELGEMLLI
jgi:hypothetical protein